MIRTVFLILLVEIWNTAGQIFFKKSANTVSIQSLRGVRSHMVFLGELLKKRYVWLGGACMLAGLVIWFIALAGADLSVVSPLGSMQYILILVTAHFFLGERMTFAKVSGTLAIVAGIILITLS